MRGKNVIRAWMSGAPRSARGNRGSTNVRTAATAKSVPRSPMAPHLAWPQRSASACPAGSTARWPAATASMDRAASASSSPIVRRRRAVAPRTTAQATSARTCARLARTAACSTAIAQTEPTASRMRAGSQSAPRRSPPVGSSISTSIQTRTLTVIPASWAHSAIAALPRAAVIAT